MLVVEITYDFGLRIETGTGIKFIRSSGKYNMIWVKD